jgi:hypothetical protein
MIIGLRNISAVCAVLTLFSATSLQDSSNARESIVKHQPQLIALPSSSTTNSQPHRVFRSILPKLKQKSQIQILLPKFVPEPDENLPIYAIIETATANKYEILLGYIPDCNGASYCRLGVVFAEAVTRKTPRLSGKTVSLAKGITGYFTDFTCGAGCSDATLAWRQKNVQYVVGIKAGDRASLVKMANSAINP